MIVIDIDNTVTDQVARLRENYHIDINIMIAKSTSETALMKDKVFPLAKEVIDELSIKHKIIWLSARKKDLYEITLKWLSQNKLHCDELILVEKLEDKLPILIKLKPTVFIDDLQYDLYSLNPKPALKFIEKLKGANINFIIYKTNWMDLKQILTEKGLIL
jgi:uncharacterized HAD superfamily protein